ncbi:MAG TPA: hypothetical protein V6D47_12890 [Oscillatoriaceae cyanobacterium]
MRSQTWAPLLAPMIGASLALGCQLRPPAMPHTSPSHALPESLTAPQAFDWTSQRVSSGALQRSGAASQTRMLQSFPQSSTAWSGGLALTRYGCAATDTVPNAPGLAYPAYGALVNKLFFLTQTGKLLRVDRLNPGNYATLDLGKTFSHTAVTMSPASTRAYLLSDDGTLFVVSTATMTVLATLQVPGGYGIAPVLDPYASARNDTFDALYVPANDGSVKAYDVTPNGSGVDVSPVGDYAVASGVTPLVGNHKLAAPALVLNGVIYVGDQAGNLDVVDTRNSGANMTFSLGAPVDTAPSIVLQDGTYTNLTDALGNPVTVPYGTPIYAFVDVGDTCAWINLVDTSITDSRGLRIDDNDATRTHGYLLDYAYSRTGTTETLAAADGGNVDTGSPAAPLPGYAPNTWSNDVLAAADTNLTTDAAGNAAGGPVVSYLRWHDATALPVGAVINQATLTLTPTTNTVCRVPQIKATSPFAPGTTTPWSSPQLATARPVIGGSVGRYASGGQTGPYGSVAFHQNRPYQWDVTQAFGMPQPDYALAMDYSAYGDAVLWPWGPIAGSPGMSGKKNYQVTAATFANNPLNANAGAVSAHDQRPLLSLQISTTRLPSATLETPPIVDARNHRVYVFYTNALYQLDFSSPAAFGDTDVDATGAAIKHTLFNLAYWGDAANGGGGTHNAKTAYVGNLTSPIVNFYDTAAYMLSRYPSPDGASPSTWNYAVSKITLPLSPTADNLVAGSPIYSGLSKDASLAMLMDPMSKLSSSNNVYFALGDGKLYQVQP